MDRRVRCASHLPGPLAWPCHRRRWVKPLRWLRNIGRSTMCMSPLSQWAAYHKRCQLKSTAPSLKARQACTVDLGKSNVTNNLTKITTNLLSLVLTFLPARAGVQMILVRPRVRRGNPCNLTTVDPTTMKMWIPVSLGDHRPPMTLLFPPL